MTIKTNAKSLQKETKTQNSQHPPKEIQGLYYTYKRYLYSRKGREKTGITPKPTDYFKV